MIVICMPARNAAKTIGHSILSVLKQDKCKREIKLIIGNDNSSDNTHQIVESFLPDPRIHLLKVSFSNVSDTRNHLNEFARKNYPECDLLGRLDSDDLIYDSETLSRIENVFDSNKPDALLFANQQTLDGKVLDWVNRPSPDLLNDHQLVSQLEELSLGNPKFEMPSCNLFIKPSIELRYPKTPSAEDHWLLASLLALRTDLKIQIEPSLIYSIYSLTGKASRLNKSSGEHSGARKSLYEFVKLATNEIADSRTKNTWEEFIFSNGLEFHQSNIEKNKRRLTEYWNQNCTLRSSISSKLRRFDKHEIDMLDVGCGPFPKSGSYFDGYQIKRTLIDPLAKEYHELLAKNDIGTSGIEIREGEVEQLNDLFTSNSFDIIYCKNALDHSHNPIGGIASMLKVLRSSGLIILEHYPNEGKFTNYYGLHQWNFEVFESEFHISNRNGSINLNINQAFFAVAKIENSITENTITTIITKL